MKRKPKAVNKPLPYFIVHELDKPGSSATVSKFLNKYLNWESVKEDTITAYTQEFTEPELKKLTEFYKTPVGKKASEKMPQLAFIAGQLGLKKAQAHQAELRQMLDDQKSKPGGGG